MEVVRFDNSNVTATFQANGSTFAHQESAYELPDLGSHNRNQAQSTTMTTIFLLVLIASFSCASALRAATLSTPTNKMFSTSSATVNNKSLLTLKYSGKLDLVLDAPMTMMLASQNEDTLVTALSRDYFTYGQETTTVWLDRLVSNFRAISTSETKSVIDLLIERRFITTEPSAINRLKVALALTAATKQVIRRRHAADLGLEDDDIGSEVYAAPVADNIASWAS